jgi:hypothetical protein
MSDSFEERLSAVEKRLEEAERKAAVAAKTGVWLRYRVVELLTKAGLYVPRSAD